MISGVYNNQNITQGIYNNSIMPKPLAITSSHSDAKTVVSSAVNINKLAFGTTSQSNLNTTLRTKAEQEKFTEVSKLLTSKNKNKLNTLLKNGRLLSNNSNDKTTTLDNLYKIITNNRATGLNAKNILNDVVVALENPYTITQKFGDIPTKLGQEILNNQEAYASRPAGNSNILDTYKNTGMVQNYMPISKDMLDVTSSSCVAASIQFNIAHKNPAEYARMAEGLTSKNLSVDKKIKLNDIAPNPVDAMWLLKEFKVQHKQIDWDNVIATIRPDRNAIIRARVQTTHKDSGERSPVDVLMQSTFMNLGSQHTYNSITDIRTGALNPDNKGLTDIEKNLAEVIAEGKNKISVTYQILDEQGKIIGYECPKEKTLEHITNALKMGENVIVGYTHTDESNHVINGHEITITGIEQRKGKTYFICNDTDDMKNEPIEYDTDYLLPKIHHAGLPHEVLKNDINIVESWVDILAEFKNARNQVA